MQYMLEPITATPLDADTVFPGFERVATMSDQAALLVMTVDLYVDPATSVDMSEDELHAVLMEIHHES